MEKESTHELFPTIDINDEILKFEISEDEAKESEEATIIHVTLIDGTYLVLEGDNYNTVKNIGTITGRVLDGGERYSTAKYRTEIRFIFENKGNGNLENKHLYIKPRTIH